MITASTLSKTDLLTRVKAQGEGLRADATNPHQCIALWENQCDEALISRGQGDNLGEMRAVAKALNGVYKKQACVTGLAAVAFAAGASAGLVYNHPAIALPCYVATLGSLMVSNHLASKTVPNNRLMATLDRWEKALDAASQPPNPGPQPIPTPEPQPPQVAQVAIS